MVAMPQIGRKLTYKRQERRFLQQAVQQAAKRRPQAEAAKPFYETATPEEWSREFLAWAESHRDLPLLPASAFSREADYEERA